MILPSRLGSYVIRGKSIKASRGIVFATHYQKPQFPNYCNHCIDCVSNFDLRLRRERFMFTRSTYTTLIIAPMEIMLYNVMKTL